MLYKLSWRSFLKQFRNYGIYLISITMAVMIYYSFNAMTHDQPLTKRASQDIKIENILTIGSFFVIVMMVFFVLSANRFFIAKRQQEVALYQLFGLKRRRIILQSLVEIFALNLLAFLVGISLGVIFSKLFSMILVKAMALDVTSTLFFSWQSVQVTAAVFLFVFIISAFQNIIVLSKKQVDGVFSVKSQFDLQKLKTKPYEIKLGIFSVLLISCGYLAAVFIRPLIFRFFLLTKSFSILIWLPGGILLACIIGTYLFYRYGLKTIFYFLDKKKSRYQGLNYYERSRSLVAILKNWRSLALLTILTSLAIALIGGAISLVSIQSRVSQNETPTDFQVHSSELGKLEAIVRENDGKVTTTQNLQYKVTAGRFALKLFSSEEMEQFNLINILRFSDYQKFQAQHPDLPKIEPLQVNRGILFDYNYMMFNSVSELSRQVTLPNGLDIKVEHFYSDLLGDALLRYAAGVLVLPDEQFQNIQGVDYTIAMVNVKTKDEEQLATSVEKELKSDWGNDIYYDFTYKNDKLKGEITTKVLKNATPHAFTGNYSRLNHTSRFPIVRRATREAGIFMYVATFLGMIASITTAAIVMLRQLSEVENGKKDFLLLQKLGVSRKQMKRNLYYQNAWIFAPPVLLVCGHAGFAIYTWSQFVTNGSYWLAYLFCGIVAVIYLVAYILTVKFFLHSWES
ncbi:FtsX-like permease family protein [Enterococcus sp. MJM12]|uniref:FtsX-like permease family protein n=1 Tax=Candidatus Enterococcus myersii TaxID=2815322 RepID=A0ABS3HA43_9ENTE|nr:ABC transporter permease [Enterococcus sp. MJM12]MBO0449760.1 FtsX-like permease family protein [Enterococcus sp. MJM12]